MARDVIYYYNNERVRTELGEIQTDFNINQVLDGTKDSAKMVVHSFDGTPLTPNTIIEHNDKIMWYVVKKDSVKRYQNEEGFYYIHSIDLNGAIELLKNRDLTDCGFYGNNYTIESFLKKLLKLSNFEYNYDIIYGNNINKDKVIDYIKSYENSTLLSAIRDFLNDFNCEVKLTFQTRRFGIRTIIFKAIFTIIPRTGNVDIPALDISYFDDVRETKVYDRDSFTTSVVSNAQNVVSTKTKTYPQVGGVRVFGEDYATSINNCYIKLPSPAFKVNWVKAFNRKNIYIQILHASVWNQPIDLLNGKKFWWGKNAVSEYTEAFREAYSGGGTLYERILEVLDNRKQEIIEYFDSISTTLYNNPSYNHKEDFNPTYGSYGTIIKEEQTPYIPKITIQGAATSVIYDEHQVVLMDKQSATLLKEPRLGLIWERGSDKITNLKSLFDADDNEYRVYNGEWYSCDAIKYPIANGKRGFYLTTFRDGAITYVAYLFCSTLAVGRSNLTTECITWFKRVETLFQVNYIPMSDLKIKQDNENDTKDIQLYNQNGKLSDSVALSKTINSYLEQNESETITKYKNYTNVNDIPEVGRIVNVSGEKYVINNVSCDFYMCESNTSDLNYYIECEFSLSKYSSTKSILVSPNTNIRDYMIPQQNNVKRKQLYRDFYNFTFESENFDSNPYCDLTDYLPNGFYGLPKTYDHIAFIKITFENTDTWYYQLSTTTYVVNKAVYEILDFNDNNIIGYDIQNTWSGITWSDLFDHELQTVTTPVSYVDDLGKFDSIQLLFLNKENATLAYTGINIIGDDGYENSLSSHCFIGSDLYDYAYDRTLQDYSITENEYYKDPIEIPVFEYSIQLGDTNKVEIGDDIFNIDKGVGYIYSFVIREKFTTNKLNADKFSPQLEITAESNSDSYYDVKVNFNAPNCAKLNNSSGLLKLGFYEDCSISFVGNLSDQKFIFDSATLEELMLELPKEMFIDKDIIVYRHTINGINTQYSGLGYTATADIETRPVMIIRAPQNEQFDSDLLKLYINYYKLN